MYLFTVNDIKLLIAFKVCEYLIGETCSHWSEVNQQFQST